MNRSEQLGAADDASTAVRLAFVTAPDAETAAGLVETLVDERLVACGNILPGLTSIYRWQGAVERESETLIILKTTADALSRVSARVAELHPYDVPEVLGFPVEHGHGPYVDWVLENVGSKSTQAKD